MPCQFNTSIFGTTCGAMASLIAVDMLSSSLWAFSTPIIFRVLSSMPITIYPPAVFVKPPIIGPVFKLVLLP